MLRSRRYSPHSWLELHLSSTCIRTDSWTPRSQEDFINARKFCPDLLCTSCTPYVLTRCTKRQPYTVHVFLHRRIRYYKAMKRRKSHLTMCSQLATSTWDLLKTMFERRSNNICAYVDDWLSTRQRSWWDTFIQWFLPLYGPQNLHYSHMKIAYSAFGALILFTSILPVKRNRKKQHYYHWLLRD